MKSHWTVYSIAMVLAAAQQAQKPAPPAPSAQTQSPASADSGNPRKRVHTDLSGFDLTPKRGPDSSVQVGGATRGSLLSPLLYAPQHGRCYTTTPTFYWGQAGAMNKFRLTVYSSSGDVVYETTVEGKSFMYPAASPPLEPGKTYSWTVEVEGMRMAEPAQPVEFVLLPREEREAIQKKLRAVSGEALEERMQRAEIFVEARVWYDAIESYTTSIGQYPEERRLYARRGEIYDQIAATHELAEKDFARADSEQPVEKKK